MKCRILEIWLSTEAVGLQGLAEHLPGLVSPQAPSWWVPDKGKGSSGSLPWPWHMGWEVAVVPGVLEEEEAATA
jgi:hypothetical protein